jgi:dTDP-4-dehydrorhamnose 3,5-epimerase
MRLERTPLPGAWIVEIDAVQDERGWFARTFDADEFSTRGIDPAVVQCGASFNARRDTLRGMHYQAVPHEEPKLVRCVRGVIFDVAVDLRPDSPTYCGWYGVELSAENRRALHVPAGLAHGFQTLEDGCEVLYHLGARHVPEASRGVRWDDPAFAIEWPVPAGTRTICERDRGYPDFERGQP